MKQTELQVKAMSNRLIAEVPKTPWSGEIDDSLKK